MIDFIIFPSSLLPMTQMQIKQQFLRQQILEPGIDPNLFIAFLVAANSSRGDNLELWTIEELQELVKAFKLSRNFPIIPIIPPTPIESVKQINRNYFDDNIYCESIQCLEKTSNKICTFSDLKIQIKQFEKVQGGFLARAYIAYRIEISPLGSCVSRRYSDFVWFREALVLLYPGYPVPPLKKKGNFKRYDDKYLVKKMLILQKFLITLATIPQLCSEPLFEAFVTTTNPKQFQSLKARCMKIQRVGLSKVKTQKGVILVSTEKEMCIKRSKYKEYLTQTQPEIKKIYKSFKAVATCLEQADDILQSIAISCKFLQNKEESIRGVLELPPMPEDNPLLLLEELTRDYGKQLRGQAASFRREIYSLMKYESLYRLNLLECMEQLHQLQQEYNQANVILLKRKEKLYSEGRMEKWGLEVKFTVRPARDEAFRVMLPKETKEVMLLRRNYALYNCQIYEECYRHTKDFNQMFSEFIRQFIEVQVSNTTQTAEIFTKISSRTIQIQQPYFAPMKV